MKDNMQLLAPTYLEKWVCYDNDPYFKNMDPIEWRGQLQSSTLGKKFRIRFYGELMKETYTGIKISDSGLIVGTDFAPSLVIAEDIDTSEEILIFDGCKHGYNAMFCDEYTRDQIDKRPVQSTYTDANGSDIFEVIIKVYHNIDYDEEMEDFLNEDGKIELLSGEIISEDTLKKNGFDYIQITGINANGDTEILSEELA